MKRTETSFINLNPRRCVEPRPPPLWPDRPWRRCSVLIPRNESRHSKALRRLLNPAKQVRRLCVTPQRADGWKAQWHISALFTFANDKSSVWASELVWGRDCRGPGESYEPRQVEHQAHHPVSFQAKCRVAGPARATGLHYSSGHSL